jgi:hypothetical protein
MDNQNLPVELQERITNEFLLTLKNCLDITLAENLDYLHNELHKQNATFWNFYQWFDNSNGFNKALKTACKLHNLMDLYTYRETLNIYDNEIIGGILMMMLYEHGIIDEGDYNDAMPSPFNHNINIKEERFYDILYFSKLSL